ncbi:MAG: hypothetical protein OXM01_01770 [Gemmatimonadota bacterium]|nr:hypothetical protein [Gemmatimonadota bacterium]
MEAAEERQDVSFGLPVDAFILLDAIDRCHEGESDADRNDYAVDLVRAADNYWGSMEKALGAVRIINLMGAIRSKFAGLGHVAIVGKGIQSNTGFHRPLFTRWPGFSKEGPKSEYDIAVGSLSPDAALLLAATLKTVESLPAEARQAFADKLTGEVERASTLADRDVPTLAYDISVAMESWPSPGKGEGPSG